MPLFDSQIRNRCPNLYRQLPFLILFLLAFHPPQIFAILHFNYAFTARSAKILFFFVVRFACGSLSLSWPVEKIYDLNVQMRMKRHEKKKMFN
jgi:hypothetical protein